MTEQHNRSVKDRQYFDLPFGLSEINHLYGDKYHLLASPYLNTMLARLGDPIAMQPMLNIYVHKLYLSLLHVVMNLSFPKKEVAIDTRMRVHSPEGIFRGELLDRDTRVICVDLARAGTYPTHICFDELNYLFNPTLLRQDHYYLNRRVNNKGEVVGVDVSGSKIGGDQEGAFVLFPDPMGATGGSISNAISYYKEKVPGVALRYIALHLVITPEYIARMKKDHPDVEVFAIRLDRGLSDPSVLSTIPGTHPEKEKGLNDKHYIVPGLGGVGEILNNSFV